jgi:hypothetical protein
MKADELAFLEESIENSVLLNCEECQDETLHTHEEVLDTPGPLREMVMRCKDCLTCRTWIEEV